MLLFSTTFKETVWNFAMQIVSNPIIIKLRQEELTLNNIRQYYFVCRNREEKYEALCNIYGSITIGQAMIFCQVKQLVCQERVVVSLQSVVCKRSILQRGLSTSAETIKRKGGIGSTWAALKGQPFWHSH